VRERLYRSRSDRMLFGVAGGMADWLDLDPSLVRLVWALLVLAGGIGFLLYIVAAIVIPEEPVGGAMPAGTGTTPGSGAAGGSAGAASTDEWNSRRQARRAARAQHGGNGAVVFGLVLIALGGWFLVNRYLNIDSALVVPGVLILLGGALVVIALGRSRPS
jgi:phage shock protein C